MKISKRDLVNKIMILQIGCVLFLGLVYSYYPWTGVLSYFPDVLNFVLLICMIERMKQGIKIEYMWLGLFIMYVAISTLWGDMNSYYIVSNLRRYVTAFIIYFVASEYMTTYYLKKGLNLMLVAQGINAIVTVYQNLVLKLHPDYCNGIFGFKTYNNAMQGIFCLIISVVAMVYFIDKKWSVYKMIYAIGTSCLICAFAEIKAYYVLIVIAFIVTIFLRCNDEKNRKKIFSFMVIGIILLLIAYKVLEIVLPENLSSFFSISQYIDYEKYGAHGGAGRLTSISYIYENDFNRDIFKTLFGCGLGGAEHNYVYTIGKLFASFGSVGILLFLCWVAYMCVRRFKTLKYSSESLISIIILVMIIVTLFVWNALFTQVVFFIFWILGAHNVRTDLVTNELKADNVQKKYSKGKLV